MKSVRSDQFRIVGGIAAFRRYIEIIHLVGGSDAVVDRIEGIYLRGDDGGITAAGKRCYRIIGNGQDHDMSGAIACEPDGGFQQRGELIAVFSLASALILVVDADEQ